MGDLLLGVDLGTTALKGVLASPDGDIVAASSVDVEAVDTSGAAMEQDPRGWWNGLLRVCRDLAARQDLSRVAAVGFSGQTHGVVLVSADGSPVRPCLTWADKRCTEEADELAARLGDRMRAVGRNDVDPTFSAPKLAWLARHEPAHLRRAERIVLPKDYLRALLTDVWCTDPSDAASTLLFDLGDQRWDTELVTEIGIDPALLPDVVASSAVAGEITVDAARDTGLPEGTPVVAGASDVACAALGAGVIDSSSVYVNIGTAAQMLAIASGPERGPFYVFQHALPGMFLRMTSVFAAGLSHAWATRLVSGADTTTAAERYRHLDAAATDVPPGSEGLLFLPYLVGRGLPYPNAHARGTLLGLTPGHGPSEVYRAVLEGVAFAIREGVDALVTTPPTQFRFGGGGRRSALWSGIIADVLGARLDVLHHEASPIGAVMLAGLGAGLLPGPIEAVARFVRQDRVVEPDPRRGQQYEHLFRSFLAVGRQLEGTWQRVVTYDKDVPETQGSTPEYRPAAFEGDRR